MGLTIRVCRSAQVRPKAFGGLEHEQRGLHHRQLCLDGSQPRATQRQIAKQEEHRR
jgi:hypothetical protein